MTGSATQAGGNKDRVKPREIVIPVATAHIGVLGGAYGADLASGDDSVGRRAAESFIGAYYAEVTNPRTTQKAWESRLSSEMQDAEPLSDFASW